MKVFVLVLAVFLVGVNSVPQYALDKATQGRVVSTIITAAIEEVSQKIREAGLDPLEVPSAEFEFALSVPNIFSVQAQVSDFLLSGLSNIAINDIRYNILTSKLTIDVSLPEVRVSAGDASAAVTILGRQINGQISGSVAVVQPRIFGEVSVRLNAGGVEVSDFDLDIALEGVEANLNVNLNDRDLSNLVNGILSERIPDLLAANKDDLIELLVNVIQRALENRLN